MLIAAQSESETKAPQERSVDGLDEANEPSGSTFRSYRA
jgi:hypothetical protein